MAYSVAVQSRLTAFLNDAGLSLSAHFLLTSSGDSSHMPRERLLGYTLSVVSKMHDEPSVTYDSLAYALDELISRRLLQQITHESLEEISNLLQAMVIDSDQPFGGLPKVDDIDFTLSGANLYLQMFQTVFSNGEELPRQLFYVEKDSTHTLIHGNDRNFVTQGVYGFIAENDEYRLLHCEEAKSCGPWFARWWLRYPEGWRIRLTLENTEPQN